MRITFVLPFADLSGGIRVPAIYAQRLIARGHHVQVVSVPQRTPSLAQKLRSLARGHGWPRKKCTDSHFDGLDVPHKVLRTARPITNRDVPDADVVVGTWWETLEWVAAMHPRKGTKVSFIQGFDPVFYEDGRTEMYARAAATWRLPAHKVLISRWLVELARDRFGDDAVSHVPNSVDPDQFHAEPRGRQARPTVGLQYAMARCKGLDVALEAVALAAKKIPSLQVLAFGRDQPHPEFPLPAGARYIQRPRQEAIREIYASCDVWLCGSRCEGFHLPPLEAMACRCPVVSTKVGGPMDVIEESRNGHLVEIEDAAALADRLVRVLSLPEPQWKAMSDAAWTSAHRYTWDEATDLFEAALRLAVERGAAARRGPATAGKAVAL